MPDVVLKDWKEAIVEGDGGLVLVFLWLICSPEVDVQLVLPAKPLAVEVEAKPWKRESDQAGRVCDRVAAERGSRPTFIVVFDEVCALVQFLAPVRDVVSDVV